MAFKLPSLLARLRIVNPDGTPTTEFHRFFNVDFSGAIERQEAAQAATDARQDAADAEIVEVQATQTAEIARLNAALAQIQATLGVAESAALAANVAQETADEALAAGTVSGSAQNPAINVPDATWVLGPVVNLTAVVAGNLTISGTGPLQDDDVAIDGGGISANGEFRVVEVVGGVDTVLFTGDFNVYQSNPSVTPTVTNLDSAAVSAFSSSRVTTGAVDYRIDARCTLGGVSSLKLYIYARRAA